MSGEIIDVERKEFEELRREITDVRHLVERTRIVLHGENGDNGIRSSLERAHKAIAGINNNLKTISDTVAQLAVDSQMGDRDMQMMIVDELRKLEHQLTEKEKVQQDRDETQKQWASRQRQWLIGQTIVIAFGVVSVFLTIFL
jgi:hypothetical protein